MDRWNSWSSPGVIRTIRGGSGVAGQSANRSFQKIAETKIPSQCACTFSGGRFSAGILLLQICRTKREMCRLSESGALLVLLCSQRAAPTSTSSQARRANSKHEVQIRRLQVRSMRILHLNTHASGGSYEHAALLCTALAEQGIESRLLSKSSQPPKGPRPFFDRVIRRSYVSLSTEPWHGTRRLLPPPAGAELVGIDVVQLHMVADWFDVPRWLETLPRKIGVVISVHDMWHITGGCFLYRGCDRYAKEIAPCNLCPILRWPANQLLATSRVFAEIACVSASWSTHCGK